MAPEHGAIVALTSLPAPASPSPQTGGAPVSKGLLLATLSSSVILQASKARRRTPALVRAFTHAFAFRAPGELLFGAALLYFYRLFERQWGSAKYGSFVAITSGLALALEAAAAVAWGVPACAGPFPLLFANLAANFVALVPPMHHFSVFGLKMTDKVRGWGTGKEGGVRGVLSFNCTAQQRCVRHFCGGRGRRGR